MAVNSVLNPTLLDIRNASNTDGSIAKIIEIQDSVNDLPSTATFIEASDITSHLTTLRSTIPTPTWRRFNEFVPSTVAKTVQVTETMGMLADYAVVDAALARLNNNAPAFLISQNKAHIEGFIQQVSSTTWFGNEATAPATFTGLAPRYASTTLVNGENVIDGLSGAPNATLTSIWLVGWSPETVSFIYPRGSTAGITMKDCGEQTVRDSNGNGMQALQMYYEQKIGLAVSDWRYVVRIANINQGALKANRSSGADLIDLMTQAMELVPSLNGVRPVFYMNRKCRSMLRRQIATATANSTLTSDRVAGKRVEFFDEVQVARSDALLSVTESLVP